MAYESAIQTLQSWMTSSCETLSIILNQAVMPEPAVVLPALPEEIKARRWKGLAFPVSLLSGVEGTFYVALDHKCATSLIDLLVGGPGDDSDDELSDMHRNVLREAMQQLVSGLGDVLTQVCGRSAKVVLSEPISEPPVNQEGQLWLNFPLELEEGPKLVLSLLVPSDLMVQLGEPASAPSGRSGGTMSGKPAMAEPSKPSGEPEKARFQPLKASSQGSATGHLEVILEVPLQVQVVLGRTRMLVQDLINLGEGSVLELDKLAGEPVELYVHDRLIALAEVIVVDERFGVKVLEMVKDSRRSRPALAS